MFRFITALTVLVLALSGTAVAQQRQTEAPPGNSAIDEYYETVPGAGGDQGPQDPGDGGGGRGNSQSLAAGERRELAREGPDGRMLIAVVAATAPARQPRGAGGHDGQAGTFTRVSAGMARTPADQTLAAVLGRDGGQGLGPALPLILLGVVSAFAARVILRRRRRST